MPDIDDTLGRVRDAIKIHGPQTLAIADVRELMHEVRRLRSHCLEVRLTLEDCIKALRGPDAADRGHTIHRALVVCEQLRAVGKADLALPPE